MATVRLTDTAEIKYKATYGCKIEYFGLVSSVGITNNFILIIFSPLRQPEI